MKEIITLLRLNMMKKIVTIGLLVFLGASAWAQSSVKGYVYEDRNGNGRMERREKGVAGVSVSNGVDVVQTDAKGRYELPVGDDNTIFVIKPAGYKVPVDKQFIPQYFYHHKPLGKSKDFKYAGVPATGKLPKLVNFGLTKHEEPSDFSVILFGDPQPYNDDDVDYFRRSIIDRVVKKENTQFGISLGDIVGDTLPLNTGYKRQLAALKLPWYHVIGNHDHNYDAPNEILADERFELEYGLANTAFNYGNAHFILLDDIRYPNPNGDRGYTAGYREDQLEFVKNNLRFVPKDKLIVIAQHIQLQDTAPEDKHFGDESERQQLLDLLKDYEHVLFLSGHTHFQMQLPITAEHGWKGKNPIWEFNVGTTSGDWYSGELDGEGLPSALMRDGTPQGYAYLNINDVQYDLEYRAVSAPEDYQIDLFIPQTVHYKGRSNYHFTANFFMGEAGDKVEFRIDGGKWKKMTHTIMQDPKMTQIAMKWDTTSEILSGRRPSSPILSSHIWVGRLDKSLAPGVHEVEVRATDRFGKTHTAKGQYTTVAR